MLDHYFVYPADSRCLLPLAVEHARAFGADRIVLPSACRASRWRHRPGSGPSSGSPNVLTASDWHAPMRPSNRDLDRIAWTSATAKSPSREDPEEPADAFPSPAETAKRLARGASSRSRWGSGSGSPKDVIALGYHIVSDERPAPPQVLPLQG